MKLNFALSLNLDGAYIPSFNKALDIIPILLKQNLN